MPRLWPAGEPREQPGLLAFVCGPGVAEVEGLRLAGMYACTGGKHGGTSDSAECAKGGLESRGGAGCGGFQFLCNDSARDIWSTQAVNGRCRICAERNISLCEAHSQLVHYHAHFEFFFKGGSENVGQYI